MSLTNEAAPALAQSAATLKRLRYLVDNEWRESRTGTYMPVMNPSTGEMFENENGPPPPKRRASR